MINPLGSSISASPQVSSQPAIASGPEPVARTESVQPRQAPAAETQSSPQRNLSSPDNKSANDTVSQARSRATSPESGLFSESNDSAPRGTNVDIET